MKILKAIKLTEKNFADYGSVLIRPERGADAENDQLAYWDNMAVLSNFTGNGVLGYLEVKRVPVKMEMMDLLTESLRLYLSADAMPSIQFVALNKEGALEPDPDTLKAFIIENGEGVVINENVWHWTPFALTEKAGFYMGLKNDIMKAEDGVYTVDDTKVKYFTMPEAVGVALD